MKNSVSNTSTQDHNNHREASPLSNGSFSPSKSRNTTQLMHLQRSIGNQATLQMLKAQQSQSTATPIQMKKTTRPSDIELLSLRGSAVADSVIAGKTTDTEKGDAIWTHVTKQYDDSLVKGGGYLTALNSKIAKYKDGATKAGVVTELTDKRAISDPKFQNNYSHTPELLSGTNYRVSSKGYDPSTTVKPVVAKGIYEGDYSNELDVSAGKIKAAWNFADSDEAIAAGKGINNSEILWDQYKLAAEEHHKNDLDKDNKVKAAQKNLTTIVRDNIINETSLSIMYKSYGDSDAWKSTDVTLSEGDEEFKAMLGTPNCKSTPFMLMDHMDELEKTLDTVKIIKGNNVEIKFKAIP